MAPPAVAIGASPLFPIRNRTQAVLQDVGAADDANEIALSVGRDAARLEPPWQTGHKQQLCESFVVFYFSLSPSPLSFFFFFAIC